MLGDFNEASPILVDLECSFSFYQQGKEMKERS